MRVLNVESVTGSDEERERERKCLVILKYRRAIGLSALNVNICSQGGWFIGHFMNVGEQAAAVLKRTQVEKIYVYVRESLKTELIARSSSLLTFLLARVDVNSRFRLLRIGGSVQGTRIFTATLLRSMSE